MTTFTHVLSKPRTENSTSEISVVIFKAKGGKVMLIKYHTWSDALVRPDPVITVEAARTEWTRLVSDGYKRNATIENRIATDLAYRT